MNYEYIIVHPGLAHRDDFLACCVALDAFGMGLTIYRREPTLDELDNQGVIVLDVGGRHEPTRRNYDHHQLDRNAPADCAFHMLARDLEMDSAFSCDEWYKVTALIDAKGPYAAAKVLGLERFPFELLSPVEQILLEMFQEQKEIRSDSLLHTLMAEIGMRLVKKYEELLGNVNNLSKSVVVREKDSISIIAWDALTDSEATGIYRKRFLPSAAILVTRDDRGPGWMLYRYDDDPRVDFTRVDKEKCVFVHNNGFIAKTKPMSFEEAIALAWTGVK